MSWDADDLALMFDTDLPGYRLATVGASSVGGVFRAPPAAAFDALVGGNAPRFFCATAELPTLTRGLSVSVNSTSYTVGDWDHLAEGITQITLEAA